MARKLTLADYRSSPIPSNEIPQFDNDAKVHRFEEYNDTPSLKCIDVAFICAVDDEYNAFIDFLQFNRIPLEYFEEIDGYFFQLNALTRIISCTVIKQRMAGMVSCACLACSLFRFEPKLFVMPGICGGIKGRVCQGDIVVASTTYDYGAGKYLQDGRFEPAPNQYQIDNRLHRETSAVRRNLQQVLDTCPPNALQVHDTDGNSFVKNVDTITVHRGTMASGAAVVNDERIVEAMRRDNRGVIAYDMEAYALAYASANFADTSIPWLVVKGIQDFHDTLDKKTYTKLAATLSIAFSVEVVKHHF